MTRKTMVLTLITVGLVVVAKEAVVRLRFIHGARGFARISSHPRSYIMSNLRLFEPGLGDPFEAAMHRFFAPIASENAKKLAIQ